MSHRKFGVGSRILSFVGIDAGILAACTLVNPLIALAAVAGLSILTICFVSEFGFVIITILISHVNELPGIDFDIVRLAKYLIVGFALVFAAWQILLRKESEWPQVGIIEKYFAIYILWGSVCLFFADSPMASVFEFFRQLALFVVYFITKVLVRERKHVIIILALIALVVAASSMYSISGLLGGAYYRLRGFMNNANNYGNTLAVVLPFVAASAAIAKQRSLKYVLIAITAMGSVALLFSWSRGAITTLIVESLVFLIIERRYRILAVLGLIPVIAVFVIMLSPSIQDTLYTVARIRGGTTHRTLLWNEGLKSIADSPIFGQGFQVKIADIVDRVYWNDLSAEMMFRNESGRFFAHNHYIQSAIATGIPGLIIFLWILMALIRDAVRGRAMMAGKRSQIFYTVLISVNCGFIYSSIFGGAEFLGTGTSANYYWILLGMLHSMQNRQIDL